MQIQVTAQRTRLCLLIAAMALAAIPASAAAEAYVPPGNSAATQYTEAVPTAGGPKATNNSKHGHSRSPDRVLGTHKTAKLDAQGPQGRAAAEVAALTAPSAVGAKAEAPAAPGPGAPEPQGGQAGSGGIQAGNGSNSGDLGQSAHSASPGHPAQSDSGGSSGIGEVVGQATGSSSSGQLGVWLPLLIAAIVIWSGAYVLRRQRKRPAG
jgi:hypothetical protein